MLAAALSAAAGDADVKASARSLFGEGVFVFSPEDSAAEIDRVVEGVFKKQHHRQFGEDRYAFLFLPGDYTKTKAINIGYYTQLLGLGRRT